MAAVTVLCPHCSATIRSGTDVPLGLSLQCLQCSRNFTVEGRLLQRDPAPASAVRVSSATPPKRRNRSLPSSAAPTVSDCSETLGGVEPDSPDEVDSGNSVGSALLVCLLFLLLGGGAVFAWQHFRPPQEEEPSAVAASKQPALPRARSAAQLPAREQNGSLQGEKKSEPLPEQEQDIKIEAIRKASKKVPRVVADAREEPAPVPGPETQKQAEAPAPMVKNPEAEPKKVVPPAPQSRLALLSLPPQEQFLVNRSVGGGVTWLLKQQHKDGSWGGGSHTVGCTALPGLTLLECGLHPANPSLQAAAFHVRKNASKLGDTYDLGLAILFLDRLGDPRDRQLIQTLALRLIAGQTENGGWGYTCPLLDPTESYHLATYLTYSRPVPVLPPATKDGSLPVPAAGGPNLPTALEKPVQLPTALEKSLQLPTALDKPGPPLPTALDRPGANPPTALDRPEGPLLFALRKPATELYLPTFLEAPPRTKTPPGEERKSPSEPSEPNPRGGDEPRSGEQAGQSRTPASDGSGKVGNPSGTPASSPHEAKPLPRPPLEPGQKVPIVFRQFPTQLLHPSVAKLPIVQETPELKINLRFKWPGKKGGVRPWSRTRDDNSNSQFALMGLWVARRHGVPMERTMALVEQRYHQSQNGDGGWSYRTGGSTAAMSCVGLIGLAMGHGTTNEILLPYMGPLHGKKIQVPAEQDESIQKGLRALSQWVGIPVDPGSPPTAPSNLYFLWSVERVAMMYHLQTIGGRDWYRWAAQSIVFAQKPDGHWQNGGYPGSTPPIDTCLALLVLRRTNLASDLTQNLRLLTPVVDPAERMNPPQQQN